MLVLLKNAKHCSIESAVEYFRKMSEQKLFFTRSSNLFNVKSAKTCKMVTHYTIRSIKLTSSGKLRN